ncbi:chemotaxis protein MotB [Alphaproteobacteria bacterium]|nr:chemotaxis protein MotB [Alphaproteobacteria bacterium]
MAEGEQQTKPDAAPSGSGGAGAPIIKRIKKGGGHPHHGGAWKIAYADFVTAMMAFFLLMWLLSAASEEQLAGIAEYFSPTAVSSNSSGAGGIMGGQVIGRGSRPSSTGSPAVNVLMPPSTAPLSEGGGDAYVEMDEEKYQQMQHDKEQAELESVRSAIEEAVGDDASLKGLLSNLAIDFTDEGMRIQVIDKEGFSMFDLGSFVMRPRARELLGKIVGAIAKLPQKIAVNGHTDSRPYRSRDGYTNWELSADRALASRREMIALGMDPARITRASGYADTEPFVEGDPADPSNRRIAIILLRQHPRPGSGIAPAKEPAPGTGYRPRPTTANPFVKE